MSELHLSDSETRGFPERGETDYLSPAETAFVQRILRRPETFPQEFWKAVMQKVALDGEPIPQSQVQGLTKFRPTVAEMVAANESTTSTSYTSLSTSGPEVNNLANGTYMFVFGAQCGAISPSVACMGLTVNAAAVPYDMVVTGADNVTAMGFYITDLDKDNNNRVVVLYKSSGGATCSFQRRWLVALKVGN